MSSTPARLTDCPNCGAGLTGAYCATCGQKSAPVNPSMRDVLHEAAHEFLNVDGKTLLVPLFAGMIALVTRGSGHNYPQHLYFALHVHAAWFLALTIGALGRLLPGVSVQRVIGVAALLYVAVSFGMALRRAYGLSFGRALWRTAAVGVVYVIAVGAAIVAVVLPVVLLRR